MMQIMKRQIFCLQHLKVQAIGAELCVYCVFVLYYVMNMTMQLLLNFMINTIY